MTHRDRSLLPDSSPQSPAEEEVRKELRTFRNLFDHAANASFLIDCDGRIFDANHKAIQIFGHGLAKLKTFHLVDLMPCERRAEARNLFARFRANGTLVEEILCQTKNGHTFPAEFATQLIDPGDDAPIAQIIVRDITARKQAEATLRDYHAIVAMTPDMMSIVDRNYVYRTVNQRYVELFNKERSEIVGHPVAALHGAEVFAEKIEPHLKRCLAGEAVAAPLWIGSGDEPQRCLDVRLTPLPGDDGEVSGAVVCSRDVTPLKHAEEALRRYAHMVAATDDLMAFIDKDYLYQGVNPSLLTALQRGIEEVVGRSVLEVLGEEIFYSDVKRRIDLALSGQRVSHQSWLEVPGLERRYLDVRYFPYRAEDETVAGVVVVIRDITRRRGYQATIATLAALEDVARGRFEPAARELTRVLADTLEVERVSAWRFEEQRSILNCLLLYKRSGQHKVGGTLRTADVPKFVRALTSSSAVEIYDVRSDPRAEEMRAYFEEQDITSLLVLPFRVGGEIVGFLSLAQVGAERSWQADELTFASEAAGLLSQTLINQQHKELEARLLQAQKMESLGVLAGGIAHDFNNLLVGILGGSDLALEDLQEGRPAEENLELVRQSATRAAELCTQLLAYAGKNRLVRRVVRLADLVQDTVPLVERMLSTGISVSYRLNKELPAVEIDPTQMRQVVMNLVTNASDAIGEQLGTVTIATGLLEHDPSRLQNSLRPAELDAGRYVYVEVTDTGCGMDAETRSRVFDPFFTTKFTGRGLGLAAAQGIVRGHGGAIGIRSAPGRGTTIRILIPASDKEPPAAATKPTTTVLEHDKGLILVVDDELSVRTIASRILERGGYEVLQAADGPAGINLFRTHANDIDAVLLDITMPVMDGEEALRVMRDIRQDVNVVLSSGFSEEAAEQRFAGYDLAGFLQKPYRADALLAKIRHVLAPAAR